MQLSLPIADGDDGIGGPEIGERVETAVSVLADLLSREVLAVAWSGGKDSTACLILALLAMRRMAAVGDDPAPLIVLHGDTLVESPPVHALAIDMLASLRDWCAANDVPLIPIVYRPRLNQSYVVKILSGTALPTFPEARKRICSASWKVEPSGRAVDREALAKLIEMAAAQPDRWPAIRASADWAPDGRPSWRRQPVIVLGSRLDESDRRAASMSRHGQRANVVSVDTVAGRRTISPIAEWSELDVWELLGLAGLSSPHYPVWQDDFAELVELYRGAAGGCVVVPGRTAGSKACGARFGCHACQAVQVDESAAALVDEPRWAYAASLLRIRDWIASIRHDFDRRSWLDCTEDPAGFIKVFPGPLAGQTIRDIARFYMTADRLEAERAALFRLAIRLGVDPDDPHVAACRTAGRAPDAGYMRRMQHPQFQVFDAQNTIACDLYASLRGHQARPFGLLQAWHEVWHERQLFFPPSPLPSRPQPLPAPRWIPVPPDVRRGWGHDILAVGMSEACPWEPQPDADGWPMMPQSIDAEFDVDAEAAAFIVGQEYPDMLRSRHSDPYQGPFAGVMYYLNIGCLILSPAGRKSLIARIKRMERWWAMGLIEASREQLLDRSISDAEYRARGGSMSPAPSHPDLFAFA